VKVPVTVIEYGNINDSVLPEPVPVVMMAGFGVWLTVLALPGLYLMVVRHPVGLDFDGEFFFFLGTGSVTKVILRNVRSFEHTVHRISDEIIECR
jgi:hypothetical protein